MSSLSRVMSGWKSVSEVYEEIQTTPFKTQTKYVVVDDVLITYPSKTERLSFRWPYLPDWNESWNDFTTVSRASCLDSKMSTYSTCCRQSFTIPKSPLVRNLFPPNQNVKMFQISKRKSCCCCCKWKKLGGTEDQRLQYCVFLALLIGIRDAVNFCTVEYFHLYFFSEQNFACICPFTVSCNDGIDHSNPIYLRLSLFLRIIGLPRTRLHLPYAQVRTSVAIWISVSLRHSNETSRASFWNGSFWLSQGTLLHLLSRTTVGLSWTISVSWSTSIDSSRTSDYDSVNMMSSCHAIQWDFQLLFFICQPFPDLFSSILLATLVFRARSVDFFKDPNELLSTFRCYGHIVRFDTFIFSDIFFDVVYAWRLEYVERFPNLGLSIITKWVSRFVVFGFFDVVALSETDDSQTGPTKFVLAAEPVLLPQRSLANCHALALPYLLETNNISSRCFSHSCFMRRHLQRRKVSVNSHVMTTILRRVQPLRAEKTQGLLGHSQGQGSRLNALWHKGSFLAGGGRGAGRTHVRTHMGSGLSHIGYLAARKEELRAFCACSSRGSFWRLRGHWWHRRQGEGWGKRVRNRWSAPRLASATAPRSCELISRVTMKVGEHGRTSCRSRVQWRLLGTAELQNASSTSGCNFHCLFHIWCIDDMFVDPLRQNFSVSMFSVMNSSSLEDENLESSPSSSLWCRRLSRVWEGFLSQGFAQICKEPFGLLVLDCLSRALESLSWGSSSTTCLQSRMDSWRFFRPHSTCAQDFFASACSFWRKWHVALCTRRTGASTNCASLHSVSGSCSSMYVRGLAAANVPVGPTSPPRQCLPGSEALAWWCAAVGALVRTGPLPSRLSLLSFTGRTGKTTVFLHDTLVDSLVRHFANTHALSMRTPRHKKAKAFRTSVDTCEDTKMSSKTPANTADTRDRTRCDYILAQTAADYRKRNKPKWLRSTSLLDEPHHPTPFHSTLTTSSDFRWRAMFVERHTGFCPKRVLHLRCLEDCVVWFCFDGQERRHHCSAKLPRSCASPNTWLSSPMWRCLPGAWSAHFRLPVQTPKEAENGGGCASASGKCNRTSAWQLSHDLPCQVRMRPELGNRRQQLRWRKCVAPETHCSRDVQSRSRKGFAHADRAKWLPPRLMQWCWEVHTRCDRHALRGLSHLQHVFLESRCVCGTSDLLSTDHFDPAKTRHEGSGTERSAAPVVRTNPSAGLLSASSVPVCAKSASRSQRLLWAWVVVSKVGKLPYWSRTKAAHTGPRSRRQRGLRPRHLGAILPRSRWTPLSPRLRTRSTRGSRLWCRVLCRRNLFSKIVKHGSQAGVRWPVIVIRDSGLRVVDVSGVWVEKVSVKCMRVSRQLLSSRKGNVSSWTTYWLHLRRTLKDCHFDDRISQIEMKVEMTLRLCLASSFLSPRSPRIPLAVVVPPRFPSLLYPGTSSRRIRMSRCFKFQNASPAAAAANGRNSEAQRTSGYNFLCFSQCCSEYGMVWISALWSTSICTFFQNKTLLVSVPGGCDHSDPIYLRLSLLLRFIRLPRTRLHLPTLNTGHQSRFRSAHLCVTPTWLRARHSETGPPDCLKGHSFRSCLGRLMACLICAIWSTSVGSSGSSDCGSVNTSMCSCHRMLWIPQLLYLICLSFPVLCFSVLLAPLVFRTRRVVFFHMTQWVGCLLFVAVRPLSASTRPGHLPRRRIRSTTRMCGSFSWVGPIITQWVRVFVVLTLLWRCRNLWDKSLCCVDVADSTLDSRTEASTRSPSADRFYRGVRVHILSQTTGDLSWTISVIWSTSIDSSRSSDCVSVNTMSPVTQCSETSSFFISSVYLFLTFACRFFSHLLCSGHDMWVSQQNRQNCCRLCVALVISSASISFIFLHIFCDVVHAWRLEYVERFPDLGLSIIMNRARRFAVFGFFSVVALSGTGGFVKSTLDCLLEQVRWRLRRGGPAWISSVTICRFYRGVRVRSIVIVHCWGFILRVDGQRLWWGHNRDDYIWSSWEGAWCGQDQDCRRWVSETESAHVWCRRVCLWDIASMAFRRAAGWTASLAVYKSDLWSLPQIHSRHLVRRRKLLVLVMLVLPVERCRTKLQCMLV